jgi:DNA-directed RNA polymerase specialized sigma24 family protein
MNYYLAKIPKHYFQQIYDRDDIRQDILVRIMERAFEFDSTRASWLTFQDRIIQTVIEDFILSQRWQKNRSTERLEMTESEENLFVTNEVHSGELNGAEQVVFAGELQSVINSMPELLRECCERLKYYTRSETVSLLGIRPDQLQYGIKKIRQILKRAKMIPEHFQKNSQK